MSDGFAIYRLPGEREWMLLEAAPGSVLRLNSYEELGSTEGFVMAPFVISDDCPLLVLQGKGVPQKEKNIVCGLDTPHSCIKENLIGDGREQYHQDFERFHNHLLANDFEKLVLARSTYVDGKNAMDPLKLFATACALYPQLFVALVSLKECGTWLMATPELLLESDGSQWHTMALAGTMKVGTSMLWSEKNLREQQLVTSYVRRQLMPLVDTLEESTPQTVRAGHLLHLRSDFTFKLPKGETLLGKLVAALHPTPAVCGLPKEAARDFIVANESGQRCYYSGFCGPLSADGSAHLFVSLRCMEIGAYGCLLHAGGGLLSDSVEDLEWEETDTKMDTMRKVCESFCLTSTS